MVSVRRRKYLGFYSGKTAASTKPPTSNENEIVVDNHNVKSISEHPEASTDSNDHKEVDISEAVPAPFSASSASSIKAEPALDEHQGVKRRKRHRRKHVENQEPCAMRGVYFKNMKWQAAIKVDKKQIHLGTVGSQEEAARLYDRAAFMCGREPNFDLSEDEKRELRQFKWEEFLEITRQAISFKSQMQSIRGGWQQGCREGGQRGEGGKIHLRGRSERAVTQPANPSSQKIQAQFSNKATHTVNYTYIYLCISHCLFYLPMKALSSDLGK
ncbi:integrase-type DNA-binding superfamily protein [Wolffia australiana]